MTLSALPLTAVVLLTSAVGDGARHADRIVGGVPVDIQQYPYMAALNYAGFQFCGATIISRKVAVTAAHCFKGNLLEAFTVRSGSTFCESGGSLHDVATAASHPKYGTTGNFLDYDVALVEVVQPFVYDEVTRPVGIAPYEAVGGQKGRVAGWGALTSAGNYPTQLMAVELTIISLQSCSSVFAVTPRMVCAGDPEGGKDSCWGDSGGGLVVNGSLVGIVVAGESCGKYGKPGIYTNIAHSEIHSWISFTAGVN